ncbi:MAG: transposase [Polaromonas sp.]|nr:transposase [Polaromonas sp.]
MARLPRLTLPNYPHHVIQRGNNQQSVFTQTEHFQRFLALLEEQSRKYQVAVHAYVLMNNHFHLLATPLSDNQGLSRMMQAVGRSYVRYFNDITMRSGTLWEGRYRSTVIQAEAYLLPCQVYIDQNPVRAGLTSDAANYLWSSHAYYLGLRPDKLITPHSLVWTLGNTPFEREVAYAELVRLGLSATEQRLLKQSALTGWPLGDQTFVAELQKKTDRRLSQASAGRPFSAIKSL